MPGRSWGGSCLLSLPTSHSRGGAIPREQFSPLSPSGTFSQTPKNPHPVSGIFPLSGDAGRRRRLTFTARSRRHSESPSWNSDENVGNSSDISKGLFQTGMCEFDPSQVSQPVTQPERVSPYWLKVPHIIGFWCDFLESLVSRKRQPRREYAESLQPKPQKFPFSRRRLAETGSITTER